MTRTARSSARRCRIRPSHRPALTRREPRRKSRCWVVGPPGKIAMRDDTVAVVISSVNRPRTLYETLLSVLRQRRLAGQIILSVPGEDDVLPETRALSGVSVIHCRLGLTRQRNGAIDALAPAIELVSFVDDDVELHDDYLERIVSVFREQPEVVLVDGRVLAD